MVSEETTKNLSEIKELITQAEEYNGQQQSNSINTKLHQLRAKMLRLSDGDVDFYFQRNNSNPRVGTYKITLKCTEEVEALIKDDSKPKEPKEPEGE